MLINQFHPSAHNGDAIGEQMIGMRRLAHADGHGGEIFCVYPNPNYSGMARLFSEYAPYSSPDNVLILHYSIGYSDAVWQWLYSIPDRKVVLYHNITPPHYFEGISAAYYIGTQRGLSQLPQLRAVAPFGWADSEFNGRDLLKAGWPQVSVLPILFDRRRYDIAPHRATLRNLSDGRPNLLYVGRIAPNKRIDDILLTFYYVQQQVLPTARLHLVGSDEGLQTYRLYLDALIQRLRLRDVCFTGHITQSELAAYYRTASAYLSMSEHEGFGVPLVESMYYGVPIIAYDAAAVAETLGDCGLLVRRKDHAAIAELIGIVHEDTALRERIVARQRERVATFEVERMRDTWRAMLKNVLETAG